MLVSSKSANIVVPRCHLSLKELVIWPFTFRSTFDHDDTNGWSCVEFSSPVAEGAIWLSDTGEQAVFKSGASCGSTRPSDVSEWSHLESKC